MISQRIRRRTHEILLGEGITCAVSGNVLGRPHGSGLPRVEGASAGTVYAVASRHLTGGEQMGHVRLPPQIDVQTAVVVLGAQSDLQHLFRNIHALGAVQFHRRGVHVHQTLYRRAEAGSRLLQILPGLGLQFPIGEIVHSIGIGAEIQIYPPAP